MRLALLAALLFTATAAHAQASWTSATGRVVDAETGAPIEGARTTLLSCRALGQPETCRPMQYSRTNEWGDFRLTTTYVGTYAVRIEHDGYCSVTLPPYDQDALRRMPMRLRYDEQPVAPDSTGDYVWARMEIAVPQPHYQIALRRPPCTAE